MNLGLLKLLNRRQAGDNKEEIVPDKCVWEFDSNEDQEHYDTACGHAFWFSYTKRDKEFKFCPYCGKEIEEAK